MANADVNFIKVGDGRQNVLFLHGWGFDCNQFLPIAQKLGGCTSFLVDLWGFGGTPSPPVAWNSDDYADKIYLFMVQNNVTNAVVVGHSFGGRVAVCLASKYPQKVSKLVLVSSAGLRRFSAKRTLRVAVYKCKKLLKRCGIVKKLPSGSADYNACDDKMRSTFVKTVNENLSHVARKVTAPTLIVWGKSDTETPLWMARRYCRLIKNSAKVLIDGGHFAFFATPTRSARIIQSFAGGKWT